VCGAYWRLRTYDRFGFHLPAHDGQLYTDTVSAWDWGATLKDMRRRAKKLGVPFRFVAIRCKEGDILTVIASVPVLPTVAHPVELTQALDVLERALDDADFGPRPVSACRAWGPLEREKEVERVPGGCSPGAFRATVKAWGAEVKAKQDGRIMKPDRAGMFKGTDGKLDAMAQADFWREAELRDCVGTTAADEFHGRTAEKRKRIQAPPIGSICSHPVDQVTETPTFDGYLNRQCRQCGEWLPCRKAGQL